MVKSLKKLLGNFIVETLERKRGLDLKELYEAVRSIYGDVGLDALNKELMKLEIRGIIHVYTVTKGRKRVELRSD